MGKGSRVLQNREQPKGQEEKQRDHEVGGDSGLDRGGGSGRGKKWMEAGCILHE